MIQLIYISSATSWPTEDDLTELLDQARFRNSKQNVTGMLLYDNATYMQVLEGNVSDVHEIYEAICNDSRNNGVVKLDESEIVEREFPGWSMGFKNLKRCSSDELPGFVDIFNGNLDKEIAKNNKTLAISMLKNFAKNT